MKKIILLLSILILFGCSKKEEIKINTSISVNKTDIEYYEDISLYNLITIENGEIITDDFKIDTKELGNKEIKFEYYDYNKNKKEYNFNVSILDTTPPIIFASKRYSTEVKEKFNILDKVVCGDNYDREMKCTYEGEYNINKIGEYPIKINSTDSNGNKSSRDTTIVVKEKISSSTSEYYYLKDFIQKYKNDDTTIAIDVSSWQGSINWNKVKSSGVDAAIIRIGYGQKI